uniref:NADH-ubiquinone oxidoreductase chain 3 n=1 Tax=Omophoita sp. REN-2018 TaxID=2506509 RepID=A0A411D9Y9_9CUCU|nr:NADH dehydrogenase subunit 3 [Omophoita sp. REN-2018]
MKTMILMSLMILLILMILTLLLNILSMKKFYDREKSSPFECGFDSKTSARLPFSLHFFLIGIIFLIFDVEISLLLPLILMMKITNFLQFNIIINFFIIILLMGLYHEWNQGSLTWKN